MHRPAASGTPVADSYDPPYHRLFERIHVSGKAKFSVMHDELMMCRRPSPFRGIPAIVLLAALAAGGCAGSRPAAIAPQQSQDLDLRLRQEVRTWEGTPHVWGGESRAGADCSGFVMRLYQDVLGISLPRTTESQALEGQKVSSRALQPGDLVFFRTAPKTRHVGIYLSDGEFAHASSSAGVRVSELDEEYWQNTFWMSRRIVSAGALASSSDAVRPDQIASPVELPEEEEKEAPPPRLPVETARMGW